MHSSGPLQRHTNPGSVKRPSELVQLSYQYVIAHAHVEVLLKATFRMFFEPHFGIMSLK